MLYIRTSLTNAISTLRQQSSIAYVSLLPRNALFDNFVKVLLPKVMFRESLKSPSRPLLHITRFWVRPRPKGASGDAASDGAVDTVIGNI